MCAAVGTRTPKGAVRYSGTRMFIATSEKSSVFSKKILENRYNINMGFIIEFIIKNIKEKGKKMMILVI